MKQSQMRLERALSKVRVSVISRHILRKGGLEKWAYQIAKAFAHQGAEVHVLTSDLAPKISKNPSLHFHTLPLTKGLNFQKVRQFDSLAKKWTQRWKGQIIFGMDRTCHQTHLRAGNGVHAAYLRCRHRFEGYPRYKMYLNPLNRTLLKIEKTAFEHPDLKIIFTNSQMVKNEILEHYNVPSDRIEVIHNGAHWKEMENRFNDWVDSKEKTCRAFHLDPALFHFIFIGNGYQRKGLHILIDALARLSSKEFHLSVIGKESHLNPFVKKAKQLKLETRIRFFGPLHDITPFLQIGDCLVIPSHYDPFANVTVEALAMGLFVVSSKTNGGHEILQDQTGTVIENLLDIESVTASLELAMRLPKTWNRSCSIRNTVQNYEISHQLYSYIQKSFEK